FVKTDIHIQATVSAVDGTYRVVAQLNDVSNALPLLSSKLVLWGVPADEKHDSQRGACSATPEEDFCKANAPLRAFVTLPTACTPPEVGLETTLAAESWPGGTAAASFFSHLPPGLPSPGPQQGPTGCESIPFHPSISLQPTTHAADSPSGLHVDLTIPQAG